MQERDNIKLCRYDKEKGAWSGQGAVGGVKFLKHKASGKVRLVMRTDTGKLLANHGVQGTLLEVSSSSFRWTAVGDVAEKGAAQDVQMMIKFGKTNLDGAKAFKTHFEASKQD